VLLLLLLLLLLLVVLLLLLPLPFLLPERLHFEIVLHCCSRAVEMWRKIQEAAD
jgi:hypothetical protein